MYYKRKEIGETLQGELGGGGGGGGDITMIKFISNKAMWRMQTGW